MPRKLKLASSIVLFVLATLSLGFALIMALATALAGMGVLTDTSVAENHAIAREAAVVLGIAYGIGLALLAGAIVMLRSYRKQPKPTPP